METRKGSFEKKDLGSNLENRSIDFQQASVPEIKPFCWAFWCLIQVPIDSGRDMKEMYVASEDTPLMVLKPRNEKHGVGFDPYENARDFEAYAKQIKSSKPSEGVVTSMFKPNRGQSGKGFGIGALEDYEDDDEDVYRGGDDGSMYYAVLYEEDELGSLQRQEKNKKKKRSTMDTYLDKTLRGGIIIGGYVPGIESSGIDESTVSSLKLLMQRSPLDVCLFEKLRSTKSPALEMFIQ